MSCDNCRFYEAQTYPYNKMGLCKNPDYETRLVPFHGNCEEWEPAHNNQEKDNESITLSG